MYCIDHPPTYKFDPKLSKYLQVQLFFSLNEQLYNYLFFFSFSKWSSSFVIFLVFEVFQDLCT